MAHTATPNPGTLLSRARWSRPENVAKRVDRLARELAAISAHLTKAQRAELLAAIEVDGAA